MSPMHKNDCFQSSFEIHTKSHKKISLIMQREL